MILETNKLVKNYIYNLGGQLLIILVPLVTTPYISRVLGPDNIGIYSYTLSISIYFVIIGNLGYPLYAQREIAYVAYNQDKVNRIFYEIFYGQLFTLGIASVAYIFFIEFFVTINKDIFFAQAIGVFASLINISWLYQGLENFRIIVLRNIFIKIFFVIFLFSFVQNENDLLLYTLIINLSNLFGNLLIFRDIKKYITVSPIKMNLSFKSVYRHIKPAFILGIPFYITAIYGVLDKTMLGKLTNIYAEVGFFEQSQKVVLLAITVVTSLGTVIMPRLSYELSRNNIERSIELLNKCIHITLLLAMPITFGIISISDDLVPWFFGSGYEKVKILLIISSPLAFIMGLSNIIGNQYFVAARMEKLLAIIMGGGLVVNFFLNLCLIPTYGSIGATISTVIAEFLKLIAMILLSTKIINCKMFLLNSMKYFLYSFIMFGTLFAIKWQYGTLGTILSTLKLILVGGTVYILVLIITKDKMFVNLLMKISSKLKYKI